MGKQRRQRNKKNKVANKYADMDGTFAFIAGYTPGGFPYGVTWEQVGIDSELSFDEKVRLYMDQMSESGDDSN